MLGIQVCFCDSFLNITEDGKASKQASSKNHSRKSLFLQKIKMEVKGQIKIALRRSTMGKFSCMHITNETDFAKPIY